MRVISVNTIVSKAVRIVICSSDKIPFLKVGGLIMIFGMSTATFTFVHVLISLIGIGSGLVVVWGFLRGRRMDGIAAIFLVTTVLTSITGFMFPIEHGISPGIKVGILSLVVLAVAIPARYLLHLAGAWRWIYVTGSMIALYLNVFVLVVQLFEKVPSLHALAPTGSEPPFLIAQILVLLGFIGLTIFAVKNFHGEEVRTA